MTTDRETKFRAGFVVIAGPANAGKSTLLNRLAGGKLSIVSPKPQTTRQNVIAICDGQDSQAVFIDTPGFLLPKYELHAAMLASVRRAVSEDADLAAMLVPPAMPEQAELDLASLVKKSGVPAYLLINKVDAVKDRSFLEKIRAAYHKIMPFRETFYISALNGEGVDAFKTSVSAALPFHEAYFPPGQWTDRWERFYVAELVREQIYSLFKQEIPYACAVEVESFTENPAGKDHIRALIYVERESQKPIIIGRRGEGIKKIGEKSRAEIEKFLQRKVHLELYVKVSPGWRENPVQVKRFGYHQ